MGALTSRTGVSSPRRHRSGSRPGRTEPPRDSVRLRTMLRGAGLILPFALVAAALVVASAMVALHLVRPDLGWPSLVCAPFLVAGIGGLALTWRRLRRQLLVPLVRLEDSVSRISQGEPGASEALNDAGVLAPMAGDIGSLNAELTELYEDMDSRVARQTMRLAQKTASLKILYDVAASIHQANGIEELLLPFLKVLKEMVAGRAATVCLMVDGSLRLIGSIGLDDPSVQAPGRVPLDLCLCGNALTPGHILCDQEARYCSRIYGRRVFRSDEIEVVRVPLEHRDELLGVYTIFVDRPGVSGREGIMDLLLTVGHHLGVAIAKQRSDAEARRLTIVEERNALAHELHDSLAQTLASLRFQVRMLSDALGDVPIPDAARGDLARVRNGIDEAHTELRELLTSFRAPLNRQGLAVALESLTLRFGRETGVRVLFQNDYRNLELSATQELQLLRIVQECLANIRKHARAHTVRVLLTRESGGAADGASGETLVVLVEDDGVGFQLPVAGDRAGDHIGLSIMEERARRIGAELRIESEPGEGTRVELMLETGRGPDRQIRTAA